MSVLHVLLPRFSSSDDALAFHRWLRHGNRLPDVADARTQVMRERFQFIGDPVPAAALRHHDHAADADTCVWLCADPAYVRSEATCARLMTCPVEDIAATDADELIAALQPLFNEMSAVLVVDTPSTWCVRLHGASRATFVQPVEALGASLVDCLPQGETGRAWRRLFNEAQVMLHAHPINARRIAAGKTPVNALWFWGEGALPLSVETGLQCVASADDVLRGLAKLGGAIRLEPAPEALQTSRGGDALLDLDTSHHIDAWLPSFQQWLRDGCFGVVSLTFASGECFQVRHAHRLRFWRRG